MLCSFHRSYNRWIGGVLNKKQIIFQTATRLLAQPGFSVNSPFQITRELSYYFQNISHPSFLEQPEEETIQKTSQEKSKVPKETQKKPPRNPKEVILAALKKQPAISIRELAAQCRMSVHSEQHHVNKLKAAGVVRHVGPTKAGRWMVVEDYLIVSGGEGVGGGDE